MVHFPASHISFHGRNRANLTENFRLLPGPMSSFIATGAQELCWFAVDRVFLIPAVVEVGTFSVIFPIIYRSLCFFPGYIHHIWLKIFGYQQKLLASVFE